MITPIVKHDKEQEKAMQKLLVALDSWIDLGYELASSIKTTPVLGGYYVSCWVTPTQRKDE